MIPVLYKANILSPKQRERNAFLSKHHPVMFLALNAHYTHKGDGVSFRGRYFLRDIYLDQSDYITIRKSTQCGLTEWLIVVAISRASMGRGVFYVLPTYSLQNRFVKNRFNKSVEYSSYYKTMLQSEEGKRFTENMSLKRFGNGSVAFIGSNAPAAFMEFPADDLIIDELDKCNMENLPLADGRLSSSESPTRVKVSNPTIEGFGIDIEYNQSDRKQWYIKCSSCGKYIQPDFSRHVVKEGQDENEYYVIDEAWDEHSIRDIKPICHLCGKPFDRFADGIWKEQDKKSNISGYHISKMFSTNVSLVEMVNNFNEGLENETKLQAFYNLDLGLAYTSKGSKITYSVLDEAIGDYNEYKDLKDGSRAFMGVDVGSYLHYVIARFTPERNIQVLTFGKVQTEDELFSVAKRYNAVIGVIDGLPETRLSKKICGRLKYWFMCFYGATKTMKMNERAKMITVDRTISLDEVKESIITRRLILPVGSRYKQPLVFQSGIEVSEFYQNMTSSTRVFNEKRQVYDWVHTEPDHYMHSTCYMLIASKLFLILGGKK